MNEQPADGRGFTYSELVRTIEALKTLLREFEIIF